jgi:hypothetical protein
MAVLYGCAVWLCCMAVLYGCVVWLCCMAVLYGCAVWLCCMAVLYGCVVGINARLLQVSGGARSGSLLQGRLSSTAAADERAQCVCLQRSFRARWGLAHCTLPSTIQSTIQTHGRQTDPIANIYSRQYIRQLLVVLQVTR